MSENSSSVTAGLEMEDLIQTGKKSAMLNRLLGRGTHDSFDMRCIVTGRSGVGKSCLVKLLAGVVIPDGRHPTDGITITEGRCGIDLETKSWIYIDPETYDALDVIYNQVLMTSAERDEGHELEKSKEQLQGSIPVRSDDKVIPGGISQKPLAIKSLSPQISPTVSKKTDIKTHMKSKMTKKEIRKKMVKVLKSGRYKMKVGRVIFWDFSGQYVYIAIHQIFMTNRALFLVVFDGSKDLHEHLPDDLCFPGQYMPQTQAVYLQHWVNSILTYCKLVYAGIPKILFVATFKDKVLKEDVESRREQLYNAVEELFKDHEGRNHLVLTQRIFVNARDKTDPEIEVLKKTITELTFEHPCWGEKIPNASVPLELEIAELVANGTQILSLEEVEELNAISEVSVLSPYQLKDFLIFNHSMGKIIYFDTPKLRDYVIINPLLMVEVMRSFVTDNLFWPEETTETFRKMSDSGILRREDLYQIWEQEDFHAIYLYKEFICNILIHLDILAEQRRYDTATGSRLPVEQFFVPCMVSQRNASSFMVKECTPERAICLAFVFKRTCIPPGLPNRLISSCLSMWTLKQYEGRKLLFSGFIVVSLDKAHDIVVCIEGNKILLFIVHKTSAGLIVPDIATEIKECLVSTIQRISEFYQSTMCAKDSQQSLFHIEYYCSALECVISEEEALQTNEWVCEKHKLIHRAGIWIVWNQDKMKEECDQKCPGLSEDVLSQRPSDNELLRFSHYICGATLIHELVSYLGMLRQWEDIMYNHLDDTELAFFLILTKWKDMKVESNFKALAEALTNMDISTHVLCQVRRERRAETDIPLEYLDCIPTDEILDTLAPLIGHVYFQLGTVLGLSVSTLELIQSNIPRDLAAQNREVFNIWREDRTIKPTIRVLLQALVNVGRGAHSLEEVLKRTLGSREDRESILSTLSQLNSEDFKDLVDLGTFASYENRVYLAGPCNIGKSSLASILIDEVIPKKWSSTDGLIIHFGRNGIDLHRRKMIPLEYGSGDVLTKLLLGNPEIKEQQKITDVSTITQNIDKTKGEVQDAPMSNLTQNDGLNPFDQLFENHQRPKTNATSKPTLSVGNKKKSLNPVFESSKGQKQPTYTVRTMQDDLLEKIKTNTLMMNIAPSDLVDFGGQKSFDMTHQLFIQHRGTFILMFDGSLGLYTELEEYPQGDVTAASILEHWINSVLTYCNKSADKMPRIVFAATHSDSFSEDEKKKLTMKFEEELTEMFSSHKLQEHIMYDKVFFINATDAADLDIESLKDTLVDIAFQQLTWGQQMPIVWVHLDLQISCMRTDGVKLITKERLLEINHSNNEFALSERRVEDFLLVQHSIGKLLYFDEPALRDFIVIQPSAMVNILRAFITDRIFWPEKGHIRCILEKLSSTGVLKKDDLFILWSQPAFKDILKDSGTMDYVVQVLLHLDILVEPRRYTKKETASDFFLVPCMVKEKIPQEIQKYATDERTIRIAYYLKETVVPSALAFKLIGASINVWPLREMKNRLCLYFQAAIMDADNQNQLQIHVEGQRVVVLLINNESKDYISPDLATTTQECLTWALRQILKFYCRSLGKQPHQVMSDLFEIEVGEVCRGKTCYIPLLHIKKENQWRCANGETHETKCLLKWDINQKKEHCDSHCKGLDEKTLLLRPNDQHFVQLIRQMEFQEFYSFFINLGMKAKDYNDLEQFHTFVNATDFMLIGLFDWRDTEESNQLMATFGILQKALKAIERQHYLCQVFREDHSLSVKADKSLQDIPSEQVINTLTEEKLIGCGVVLLGVELGLSICNIRETMHNFKKDLNGQIHDLLMKWRKRDEKNKVKPTIYRLMVALKHVKAAEGLSFVKKTYGVE